MLPFIVQFTRLFFYFACVNVWSDDKLFFFSCGVDFKFINLRMNVNIVKTDIKDSIFFETSKEVPNLSILTHYACSILFCLLLMYTK